MSYPLNSLHSVKRKLMNRLTSLLLTTVLIFLSFSSNAWTLDKQEDGISVYTKTKNNSDFKAFRGEVVVESNIETILGVINDVESMENWLHECSKSQILERKSANEVIVYQETNAPWPVSDRSFILKMTTERSDEGKQAKILFTAIIESDSDDTSKVNNEDCVRVTELEGKWLLKQVSDTSVHILYETSADPAGSIPAWLANAFVVDQPFNTLKNLRSKVSVNDAQ